MLEPGGRTIIGMIHLAGLPGSPAFDRAAGMAGIIARARADAQALQAGGVDGVMFGNEMDRPYVLAAPAEGIAAMAAAVEAVKPALGVPFGIDYLWDPVATVALAVATGAAFAREIFTGVFAADMGLWRPDGARALRLRADLGRPDLKLLFNVNAEFGSSLDARPVEERARSAVFSSTADVLCVSGAMTGEGVDRSLLARVKAVAGNVPVLANTGVTIESVGAILAIADGCVVGTHFKKDGNTWNAVDQARVARFMKAVAALR